MIARATLVQELQDASLDHAYATGKKAASAFLPLGLGHIAGAWWAWKVRRAHRRLKRVRRLLAAARSAQEAQAGMHRAGRRAEFTAATIRDQHRKGPPK